MPAKKRKSNSNQLNIDLRNTNTDMQPLPHPFFEGSYGDGQKPKSRLELKLMSLSSAIRSKQNWHEKMNNQAVCRKWKEEALGQGELTEKQIDYVLSELKYYASLRENSIEMSTVDGVWQSDALIPSDVKQSLLKSVKLLEDVPENERDWHPGTNEQVLNLVHPSLFCLVFGETKIINENDVRISLDETLNHFDEGETIEASRVVTEQGFTTSSTYQWLPSDFSVLDDGHVKIESYINNLHPVQHENLYKQIEKIFAYFLPLFSKTLTDLSLKIQTKPSSVNIDPYSWYASETEDSNEDSSEGLSMIKKFIELAKNTNRSVNFFNVNYYTIIFTVIKTHT